MSIEDLNKIDLITVTCDDVDPSQVILVITDHLQWSEFTDEHLYKLQEKINKYIEFVESGEMLEKYPDALDKDIIFKIFFKYKIPHECIEFVKRVREILLTIKIQLTYEEKNITD
ncbi:DUF6572 domain-containing protein [Providencia vermicola]|uniref:DUF6572 domain-containing protein n=1 Tax=Providencia vermicola TaxID=333965 RepID=UPI0032DA7D29